jgi:hypothetical protein
MRDFRVLVYYLLLNLVSMNICIHVRYREKFGHERMDIKTCVPGNVLRLRGGNQMEGGSIEDLFQSTNFKYGSLDFVEDEPARDQVEKDRYLEKYMNATGLNRGVSRSISQHCHAAST